MNALKNTLKFQTSSFLKTLITSNLIGIAVVTGLMILGIATNSDTTILSSDPDYLLPKYYATLVVYLTAIAMVSGVVLISKCFTIFYKDLKLSLRLGITRKNFVLSNIIFFTLTILVFAALGMIASRIFAFSLAQTPSGADIQMLEETVNYSKIANIIFTMLFFVVGMSNITAVLVFLLRWKSVAVFVLHNILYATVVKYQELIDYTFYNLNLTRGIIFYVVSLIIISITILMHNDDN